MLYCEFIKSGRLIMDIRAKVKLLISVLVLIYSCGASAVILNPLPALYGADDGSGLFMPNGDLTISIEVADPLNGEFGFYYDDDPVTRIPIFDILDVTIPGNPATAVIDFNVGVVLDLDQGVLQGLFTPGMGAIGFYLAFAPNTPDLLTNPIYTDPALNIGALDLAAAFPALDGSQSYLLGFEAIFLPSGSDPLVIPVAFNAVNGIGKVPEPATVVLLLVGGMFGVGLGRKRLKTPISILSQSQS